MAHVEWDGLIYPNGTNYPSVPGHEIVGRVTSVASDAKRFKVGEVVAVRTMVQSCLECDNCKAGLELYCEKCVAWTYNSPGITPRVAIAIPSLSAKNSFKAQLPGTEPLRCGAASALCWNHHVVAIAASEDWALGEFGGMSFKVSEGGGAHGWTNCGEDNYCAISFSGVPVVVNRFCLGG
jgi:hypothetical protein